MYQSVAILIFAREASKESSLKFLAPKNQLANKQILQNLNILTQKKTTATKIPVFVSNELGLESKGGFGQNFSEAISNVFSKGFEKVICIGNDCPALQKQHLISAAEALTKADTVIGPDFRGGTYLIGLTKRAFNVDSFQNLPWQSSELLEGLVMSFSGKYIHFIDQLPDINSFKDLVFYPTTRHIVSFLLKFINKFQFVQFSWVYSLKSEVYLFHRSFRGPPIFGF